MEISHIFGLSSSILDASTIENANLSSHISSSDNINLASACNYSAKVLENTARAKLVLDPPCHINKPLIPSRCFSKQHKRVLDNQMFLNMCNIYQNNVGECDSSQIF